MARALVAAGADVNFFSSADYTGQPNSGVTEAVCLCNRIYAAFNGQDEIARMLLAAGAEANAPNHDGSTPLHAAVAKGRPEMIELLLQAGADSAIRDDEGHTPLSTALNLVRNCIEEVPPAWHAFGFPLEGEEADAIRRIVTMLEAATGA